MIGLSFFRFCVISWRCEKICMSGDLDPHAKIPTFTWNRSFNNKTEVQDLNLGSPTFLEGANEYVIGYP